MIAQKKEDKKYTIVLIRNGETIVQYGLDYSTKEEAEYIADYMTSLLTKNCKQYERYSVVKKSKIEDDR